MTHTVKQIFTLAVGIILISACGPDDQKDNDNERPIIEDQPPREWTILFDGSSLDGWRGFNSDVLPSNWIIEEESLKSLGTGGDVGGDIVYGLEQFDNFELVFEWKISEGGNSGVFYHVVEGEQYKAPYETAPEYQVLDDLGFPDPLEEWQMVGADYAMHIPEPGTKNVKPAGEWNTSKIYFTEERAEYWLNGEKLLSFVPWSVDWYERRNSGKWDDYPDYGLAKTGLIGIQDHGSFIWYKNIKIRKL